MKCVFSYAMIFPKIQKLTNTPNSLIYKNNC